MQYPSDDQEIVRRLEDAWGLGPIARETFQQRCQYDEEGHLIALDLLFWGLPSFPPEMGQLRHLRTLHWGGISVLPAEIGLLTSLKVLDLRGSGLSALPAEIAQLTQLHTLALEGANFRSFPRELLRLPALRNLFMPGIHRGGAGLPALPADIGRLTTLEVLDLEEHHLTEVPPGIGQLTRLQVLNLRRNELSRLPPELGDLVALRELYLGYNQLTTLPNTLGRLKHLETLYLHDNQLTTLPPELEQLTSLQDLAVENNPLVQVMRSWSPLRFEMLPDPAGQIPPQGPVIEQGVELGVSYGHIALAEGDEDRRRLRVKARADLPSWLAVEEGLIRVRSPNGHRVDVHLEAWTYEPPQRLDPWDGQGEVTLQRASGIIAVREITGPEPETLFSFGSEPWDYQLRIYRRSRPDLHEILRQSFAARHRSPHHLERFLLQFWPA